MPRKPRIPRGWFETLDAADRGEISGAEADRRLAQLSRPKVRNAMPRTPRGPMGPAEESRKVLGFGRPDYKRKHRTLDQQIDAYNRGVERKRKKEAPPLPAPAPVKRARKRIKTVKLTGDPFSAIRKAAGIEKAKRTKRTKAVHKRATALRHDPEFMGTYHGRKAVASAVKKITRRGMRGEPKGAKNYFAHKDYRRALANPKLYMESYNLDAAGRKRRKRKSA